MCRKVDPFVQLYDEFGFYLDNEHGWQERPFICEIQGMIIHVLLSIEYMYSYTSRKRVREMYIPLYPTFIVVKLVCAGVRGGSIVYPQCMFEQQ